MRKLFKNKKGRMGLDIPEIKAKRDINGKRKRDFADNGLIDFKKVCVTWGLKNFFPSSGKEVKTRRG